MKDSTIIMNQAMANQGGQALQIQNYSNSVKEQSPVNFSQFPNLKTNETDINNGLKVAKSHADEYLDVIQPQIITNITSIDNYFSLYKAIPAVLPKNSTKKEWITQLSVLKEQAEENQKTSKDTKVIIIKLRDNLTGDSSKFNTFVTNLNSKVDGDNGVLTQLSSEIDSINSAISGAIAGIVAGGLLIIGGAFVTAIGAVADFVTAGASTPVVVGGVTMMVAGAAGVTAGAIVLHNSLNARQGLYQKQSTLKSEVKLASAISSGYVGLLNQAHNSVTAATQMGNAWDALTGDIGSLITDISNGITGPDAARQLWLTAANTTVKTIVTDISTVKGQMSGVSSMAVPSNVTIADFVAKEAA